MTHSSAHGCLGVLGGMGPLASAEFLKTIYEFALCEREQDAPPVLLFSDPAFPDRTTAFLDGQDDMLLDRLVDALRRLCDFGVGHIVIPCVTIHHVLPRVEESLRRRVVSLIDVTLDHVRRSGRPHLMLCTTGTRRMEIFQRHPLWDGAKHRVVLPDDADQEAIHDRIYEVVKRNGDIGTMGPFVESLLKKYDVRSFIAGCTELHLVSKRMTGNGGDTACIDPLIDLARQVAAGRIGVP